MNEIKNTGSKAAEQIGMVFLELESASRSFPGAEDLAAIKFTINDGEVLMVLTRVGSAGNKEVAFIGSETLAGACRKLRLFWGTGKLVWRRDKFGDVGGAGTS